MRVLSMFDGISCGRVALERVGITPEVYYASEVDPHAERVSADNYPDIIRLGDAFGVESWDIWNIDLLLGGSPCTHWSIAQKDNRETESSGIGWELFSLYAKAIEVFHPRYFLYENVRSLSSQIRCEITRILGVEPININSALVSAQTRNRLYWTNIPGVQQPEDKKISLCSILEPGGIAYREKAECIRATYYKCGGINARNFEKKITDGLGYDGVLIRAEECSGPLFAGKTPYTVRDGEIEIHGSKYKMPAPDGLYYLRKYTVNEACRLQTLPDNYCRAVSDTQAYKGIGNGWTIDVIAHILTGLATSATGVPYVERRSA